MMQMQFEFDPRDPGLVKAAKQLFGQSLKRSSRLLFTGAPI